MPRIGDLGLMISPPWHDEPEHDEHREEPGEMCPMGCGDVTEDVYGGPCYSCWAEIYAAENRGPHA